MPLLFTPKKGLISALNFTRKHFVIWCARSIGIGFFFIASVLSANSVVFTGTLVRKYYQHLIPQAVELSVFGWFLELDSFSKICLQEKIAILSEEDRQCCARFAFDASFVQLCLSGEEDRLLCRRFEGSRVEALGEWPSSPHVFRPIPSYQLHLTELKQVPEDVVSLTRISHTGPSKDEQDSTSDLSPITREHCPTDKARVIGDKGGVTDCPNLPGMCEKSVLSGILCFKVFPGPPNYDCVEDGDYPEGCWVLKLDDRSKDMLAEPMSLECGTKDDEITIEVDKQCERALKQYANAQVTCLGYIHHGETAHHHTPLLLRSCRIALNKAP